MTPEREAEIRRNMAHLDETGYFTAHSGMVRELLSALDEARRQLPCGHTRDADGDGGCTVCRLRADCEENRACREKAEAACAAMRYEAFGQAAKIKPLTTDISGPCVATVYGEERIFKESSEALAWTDTRFTEIMGDAGRGWLSPSQVDALLAEVRPAIRYGGLCGRHREDEILNPTCPACAEVKAKRDKEDAR